MDAARLLLTAHPEARRQVVAVAVAPKSEDRNWRCAIFLDYDRFQAEDMEEHREDQPASVAGYD